MRALRLVLTGIACTTLLPASELKVATLHPLLTDLARQVGGERVEVVDLIGATGDPHHFEPKPEDLKRASGARLYLAAGMGLESYLPAMRSVIGSGAGILEVGASLPGLPAVGDHSDHLDCNHETDPHWWHSIDRFRRATTLVAEAFATADPAAAEVYRANAATYRETLDRLETWTRLKIATIPRDKRQLATTHAAFNYFCSDFGFEAFPIEGINREQSPDPTELAALIGELKSKRVATIFPENESNPKLLAVLTRDTGIRLGKPLIADGTNSTSYEAMVRSNVETIVEGLSSPQKP